MTIAAKSAAALALLLALSACGGETPDDAAAPGPTDTSTAAVEAAATDAVTPAPTDTPTDEPTPAPTPTSTSTSAASAAPVSEPAAFAQCKACHSVEAGDNGIGPSLAGVFGNKAGTASGFTYSDAMKNSGLTWNQATLDRFLADPAGVVPGNNMPFAGVKDAGQRQQIVSYLRGV